MINIKTILTSKNVNKSGSIIDKKPIQYIIKYSG